MAADELGLDPIDLRRRNLLSPDELPLDRGLSAIGTTMTIRRRLPVIMQMAWRTEKGELVTNQPPAPREERARYEVEGNKLLFRLGGFESRWLRSS